MKPVRVLALCAVLLCFLNYLSAVCKLTYWQPDYNDFAMSVFTYQRMGEPCDVLFIGSSRVERGILSKTVEQEIPQFSANKT
ncbi:MAG: hypothetical protein HY801_07850, partial [Candidatus Lindowbacteria bacterium]|nr:hypothetical protein [Candidatus Lindowbacteria bacterium]